MFNKSRIIRFNKISLGEKKIIITKLWKIIYFGLYTILIHFLHTLNIINYNIFSFLFIFGLIILCIIIFSSSFHVDNKKNKFLTNLDFRMKCPENCTRIMQQ